MEFLLNLSRNKIKNNKITTKRYLYEKIDIDNRLIGILGARGTGKTTLMLQLIKEKYELSKTIYMSLDHIFFLENKLINVIENLYTKYGIKNFFLDEIHKYKNWEQEIKNVYDFYNDIQIIFSGSSSINIKQAKYDLSRRCVTYILNGLSFREFLNIKYNENYKPYDFQDLINNHMDIAFNIAENSKILLDFQEYYKYGYYPIYFENPKSIVSKIINMYEKVIYEDIVEVANLNTENLIILKKLIYFIATMQPGKININSLSKNLKKDNKTIINYISKLEDAGLLTLLFKEGVGGTLIRSPEKIYIGNGTLYNAINEEIRNNINIGNLREIIFVNQIKNSNQNIRYSKEIGDFNVNSYYFEIGGKNKSKKQIKNNIDNSFIVKDDILYGEKSIIPLYLFGFLY
ncbi:ATP-binding protein [Marinitoga aeolica]|uniref:ATP-binding protein n=1 Tax=Marinitoga aeolica TaxID=2809031 RepID=A0ABY8PPZ1_9BACT|nr:AAA family ATPase [Marinitoga aeolica]WGS64708.1 ATP-binding protein [Marinitoga aeolica]